MATFSRGSKSQVDQTRFRLALANFWGVPLGSKVLEVGCGQGDMTAVLAHLVGSSGLVVATDRADPSYGAPVTLGDSASHLLQSPLGSRIEFHFNFDLLTEAPSKGPFDGAVMALCSWYFASIDELMATLVRIRSLTNRLYFAEWDMLPSSYDQLAHLLAVLIQGHVGALRDTTANIRTPLARSTFLSVLEEAGWKVVKEAPVSTSEMLDARWEIEECLCMDVRSFGLPPKHQEFVQTQIDLLKQVASANESRSLNAFAVVAEPV